MAILSQRITSAVSSAFAGRYGVRPSFVDLSGRVRGPHEMLSALPPVRRKRDYALQESVNMGEPRQFQPGPGLVSWIVGLEDRRMVHGGAVGGDVRAEGDGTSAEETLAWLEAHGLAGEQIQRYVLRLPVWPRERVDEAARFLSETFYAVSGWHPELMKENRLRAQQRQQINQAIEDQRRHGKEAIYAFEKERTLLANIRAGDRNEARRLLNEMLAAIYMSSPELVVLRARAVELITCLTRAAIEDNPLLEPLIERNHAWTEQLITARDFEDLSRALMSALDDFMDGIYLHGLNRSNTKVRKALDFISRRHAAKITLAMVAEEVGLSSSRLCHLVKAFTGRSVLQILQQVRVRHAQQLLERTDMSCTDIAYEVGYGDKSYFIRHFRRLTGKTPGAYRRARK